MSQITTQELYDKVPQHMYGIDYYCLLRSLMKNKEWCEKNLKDKTAFEMGCGAGHLTVYLSKYFKYIDGADFSKLSIVTAIREKQRLNIKNVYYYYTDLFSPKTINSYDYVLCSGVLHHTGRATEGFLRLQPYVKKNGLLTIGVYSRTNLRYRLARSLVIFLAGNDADQRARWAKVIHTALYFKYPTELVVSDGYVNPVVTYHSIREVYSWFTHCNYSYVGSYPPIEITMYPKLFVNIIKWKLGKIPDYYSFDESPHKQTALYQKINYNRFSFFMVECIWALAGIFGVSVMLTITGRKNEQ